MLICFFKFQFKFASSAVIYAWQKHWRAKLVQLKIIKWLVMDYYELGPTYMSRVYNLLADLYEKK